MTDPESRDADAPAAGNFETLAAETNSRIRDLIAVAAADDPATAALVAAARAYIDAFNRRALLAAGRRVVADAAGDDASAAATGPAFAELFLRINRELDAIFAAADDRGDPAAAIVRAAARTLNAAAAILEDRRAGVG